MDIADTIRRLLTTDDDVWQGAQADLVRTSGLEVVSQLVGLLRERDPRVRNRAAATLRMMRAHSAVKPLLSAIQDPRNAGHIGSLVRALQTLNCTNEFAALFRVVLNGKYEVRAMGLPILRQQQFDVAPDVLRQLRQELDDYGRERRLQEEDGEIIAKCLAEVLDRIENEMSRPAE